MATAVLVLFACALIQILELPYAPDGRTDLAALEEIDSRYRESIFLVYVEGLKVEEAARMLSVPAGTVNTRLMRGRAALRRILARRHPEHFGGSDALS